MPKARRRRSWSASAAGSSSSLGVRSCSRVRSATRTTAPTTSRRWAPAAASGWSGRRTVPSRCSATEISSWTWPTSLSLMTAVLFTCAGQRVDIVGAFARAGATTIATDVNPLAPALYHAEHHELVPRIVDPDYVPALRRLVDAYDVRLIVPLTDLDQAILARARYELGALVLLPDADTVERLADKYQAHLLFERKSTRLNSSHEW